MPLSVQDFSSKIKAKYPQYKDIPDEQLARKIVDKHPEYKDQVDFSATKSLNIGKNLKSASDFTRNAFGNFVKGQLQSAATSAVNIGEFGSRALQSGYNATIGRITGKDALQTAPATEQVKKDYLTPTTVAGKVGFASSQVGESLLPIGQASRASLANKTGQAVSRISRSPVLSNVLNNVAKQSVGLAGDVGESVLKTTIQTGDVDEGNKAGKVTAALGGVVRGSELLKDIVKPISGRVINSLIKPQKRDFVYGKNPGRTIAKEGITANSLDDLQVKVSQKANDIGKELDSVLKGKVIDGGSILSPIDDAIKTAASDGPQNASLVRRLKEVKQSIQYAHGLSDDGEIVQETARDLSKIKGEEVRAIKSMIGRMSRWTENPSDDELVNKTLQKVYGNLKKATEKVVPESKILNTKLADLIGADSALTNRLKVLERQNLVSLPDIGAGFGAGTVASILSGGAAIPTILAGAGVAGVRKLLGTTAAKTRIASWLEKASSQEKQRLYKAVPQLMNIFKNEFGKN